MFDHLTKLALSLYIFVINLNVLILLVRPLVSDNTLKLFSISSQQIYSHLRLF